MAKVEMRQVKRARYTFWIRGISPLIQHAWSKRAIEKIVEKQAGKKTKDRDDRNPQQEAMDAAYRTDDGKFGIPGRGLKAALIGAAHKDIGIEKTLVRKAGVYVVTNDKKKVLAMECDEPTIRDDMVRVSGGGADIRYRPMWNEWRAKVTLEVDSELLTKDDVATLVSRAGFGVGICEWRPEKGGEYGRFEIDTTEPFQIEQL